MTTHTGTRWEDTAVYSPADDDVAGPQSSAPFIEDAQDAEQPSTTLWEHHPLPQRGKFPPLFALVGAHGGAGVSTLDRLWAPAVDTDRKWPAHQATTQRVFVVAREHMAGIAAAAELLRAADAGRAPEGVRVCGLVTVAAHPGKAHRDVARYRATVGELVPRTYRIPWLSELIPLLHKQLPEWQPADGAKFTRRSDRGELLTVPGAIALVGHNLCADLLADEAASKLPQPR